MIGTDYGVRESFDESYLGRTDTDIKISSQQSQETCTKVINYKKLLINGLILTGILYILNKVL